METSVFQKRPGRGGISPRPEHWIAGTRRRRSSVVRIRRSINFGEGGLPHVAATRRARGNAMNLSSHFENHRRDFRRDKAPPRASTLHVCTVIGHLLSRESALTLTRLALCDLSRLFPVNPGPSHAARERCRLASGLFNAGGGATMGGSPHKG